ncbi:hypothetical protein PMAC_001982 [Pneumocystis sp. 'macacae']|nr:hypothetical protein PMAC_001982 [Pneumocystis sp. 'macacae']
MGNYRSNSLIRRYLSFLRDCSSSDKLPSLTSSALVDVELYSIIAIICRDYINVWYEQMTHDKNFIEELLFLVSHIVKELEKRFFMIRHDILLLDSIPMIAVKHINGMWFFLLYINSHKTFDDVFRGFQLHTALDSYESEHLYLRLVADGLITFLLPSSDLGSECERVIIREILSDLVLKRIIDKLSEPSILFEIITKHIFTEELAINCFRLLRTLIWSNNSSDVSKTQYSRLDNYEIKEKLVLEVYTIIPVCELSDTTPERIFMQRIV